jgi:hypothetical protein
MKTELDTMLRGLACCVSCEVVVVDVVDIVACDSVCIDVVLKLGEGAVCVGAIP